MVFTNTGVTEIKNWLAGSSATAPTHINVGSGSTRGAKSDTVLGTEIGTRIAFDSTTTSTNSVKYSILIASTEKNGYSFREVGMFNASTSGDMFTRGTHTVINKTDTIEVQYEITIAVVN